MAGADADACRSLRDMEGDSMNRGDREQERDEAHASGSSMGGYKHDDEDEKEEDEDEDEDLEWLKEGSNVPSPLPSCTPEPTPGAAPAGTRKGGSLGNQAHPEAPPSKPAGHRVGTALAHIVSPSFLVSAAIGTPWPPAAPGAGVKADRSTSDPGHARAVGAGPITARQAGAVSFKAAARLQDATQLASDAVPLFGEGRAEAMAKFRRAQARAAAVCAAPFVPPVVPSTPLPQRANGEAGMPSAAPALLVGFCVAVLRQQRDSLLAIGPVDSEGVDAERIGKRRQGTVHADGNRNVGSVASSSRADALTA